MSAPSAVRREERLAPHPGAVQSPGRGEPLRCQLLPRLRHFLGRWRVRRSIPARDRSFRRWSCRSSQTSGPWRRGIAGTSLGQTRRRSPTPRTHAKWQVAARWRSRGMTRRRRKRWGPWRPGYGGQGEPRASSRRCWRRRRMPSWRPADRWGIAVLKPSAPPSEWLSSRWWVRRVARRHAQRIGAPSAPVTSAGQSVGDAEVPRGPQHPCCRALASRRQVRRGPGLARFAAAYGVRHGW
jgi:hypothetical protein